MQVYNRNLSLLFRVYLKTITKSLVFLYTVTTYDFTRVEPL